MSVLQIVGGVIIFVACFLIIILSLAQSKKTQDMGSALSGQANDSFFGKSGKGSSREDALASLTKIMAVIFFVGTLLLNTLMAYGL
ncbi:MAG: preprotein translocase subunit SecG [Oscillospiraceae bacterium]|nr:preprotein translocase subunit SecG [Oscillospiraceae bacterium]